jgi:hypothetical protein
MTTKTTEPQEEEKPKVRFTAEENRKMAIIDRLDTKPSLEALRTLIEGIPDAEHAVAQAKLAVQLAQESLDFRAAELVYGVEGKNAEERKADLLSKQQADPEHKKRLKVLREAQAKVDEAEREAKVLRHRERFHHARLALVTAIVQYLARGE